MRKRGQKIRLRRKLQGQAFRVRRVAGRVRPEAGRDGDAYIIGCFGDEGRSLGLQDQHNAAGLVAFDRQDEPAVERRLGRAIVQPVRAGLADGQDLPGAVLPMWRRNAGGSRYRDGEPDKATENAEARVTQKSQGAAILNALISS